MKKLSVATIAMLIGIMIGGDALLMAETTPATGTPAVSQTETPKTPKTGTKKHHKHARKTKEKKTTTDHASTSGSSVK